MDSNDVTRHRLALDDAARTHWAERMALPASLLVPIAARDEESISQLVGKIVKALAPGKPSKALLVQPHVLPTVDERLPIWSLPSSTILRQAPQVWVHFAYTAYRPAYMRAFPNEDLDDRVLDHIRNRRVAELRGFQYLRIVPISPGANASSGWTTESLYELEYHRSPEMVQKNKERQWPVNYADLADLVKMLDLKTGGTLQDGVNEGQALVRPVE